LENVAFIAVTSCGFSQPLQYNAAMKFRVAEGGISELQLNVGFCYVV
jgi:hypothetical protein